MKGFIADYVSRCIVCRQVKIENQSHVGQFSSLPILEWKWDLITMDFVDALSKTNKQHDCIRVIVGQMTKIIYFLLV